MMGDRCFQSDVTKMRTRWRATPFGEVLAVIFGLGEMVETVEVGSSNLTRLLALVIALVAVSVVILWYLSRTIGNCGAITVKVNDLRWVRLADFWS